jgi:hypothetical protein
MVNPTPGGFSAENNFSLKFSFTVSKGEATVVSK